MTGTAMPLQTPELTIETFGSLLNQEFDLVAANHCMTVTLVDIVAARPDTMGTDTRHPFTLLFRAPLERLYPDGLYRLEHPAIGHHVLYVSAAGPEPGAPDTMRYRINFG